MLLMDPMVADICWCSVYFWYVRICHDWSVQEVSSIVSKCVVMACITMYVKIFPLWVYCCPG